MADAGTAVFSAIARFGPAVKGARDLSKAMEGVESATRKAGDEAVEAEKKSTGFVRNFGSKLWSGAGKALKVGAAATGAAAGALFATSLAKGMGRLVAIDTARGKLRGLGHDAEAVDAIMKDALASVRGTAFGMDEAATTAAGAVAAGIEPGKELTRYLSIVADTAAIAGVSMAEMGQTMNRVQTAGVAMSEDIGMLGDKGIPILQWLSEEYGVTATEMKKMVSEGKVDAETYARVIEDNIGGAALQMGDTFAGALKNTWAALGRVGANLLEGIFPYFQKALNGIMDLLGPVEDKAKAVGAAVGEWLADKIESAMGVWERAQPTLSKFADVLGAVWQVLSGGTTGRLANLLDIKQDHPAIKVLQKINDFVTESIPAGMQKAQDVAKGLLNLFTGKGTGGLANALGVEQSDPIIKVFTGIRDAVKELGPFLTDTLFPALVDVGGTIRDVVVPVASDLWDWFVKIADVVVNEAVPALYDIGQNVLPVVSDALGVVGGFLSEHHGLVIALIAAWAGWKAVNALMNAYRAVMVVVTGVKAGYAAATYGIVGATYAQNAAERVGIALGWAKVAATKAMTIAQRAFNLVLRANPIGIIITLLAAFVAGLVLLYKNNETARRIIDAAWAGIKAGIDAVVKWFTGTAWPWLRDAFTWIGDKAKWLWQNAIKPAWDGIKSGVSAVVSWVKDTAWPWMRDAFQNMANKAGDIKDKIVSAWNSLKDGISRGWDAIKKIFDRFKDGLQAVRDKFGDARDGISRIWATLAQIIVKPINGVIDVVNRFLRGLHRMLSKIPGVKGKLGEEWGNIPHVVAPSVTQQVGSSGRAAVALWTGGRVPGSSPHERADNIPAMLTADEEVIRRRSARNMRRRFPGWMEHVNRFGRPPGYATGGRVGRKPRTGDAGVLESAGNWLKGLWDDAKSWVTNQWKKLIPTDLDDSWAGTTVRALLENMDLSGLVDWVKGKFQSSQGGGGVNYGGPYGWAPVGWSVSKIIETIRSVVPNAVISSTVRQGAVTASGIPSLHGLGRAVDWYTPGMAGMVEAFRRVGSLARWSQHFYTPAGAGSQQGYVDENIRRMHRDHAHTAMRLGGWVPGSGTGDRTKVLAEPREFMVNRAAARRWGPLLTAINDGALVGSGRVDLFDLLSQAYAVKASGVRRMTGVAAGVPTAATSEARTSVEERVATTVDWSDESIERLAAALDRHARKVSVMTAADHALMMSRRDR